MVRFSVGDKVTIWTGKINGVSGEVTMVHPGLAGYTVNAGDWGGGFFHEQQLRAVPRNMTMLQLANETVAEYSFSQLMDLSCSGYLPSLVDESAGSDELPF